MPLPLEMNELPIDLIPQNDIVARRVTLVQVVDPKLMENLTFGNKTSFEILEDTIGCNSTKRARKLTRQCQNNCGGRLEILNSTESWCRINCGCTTFTCLLGNPPPMPAVSEIHVYPPPAGASDRLIPRIIHQTWKEPITKARYPSWSGFQQSFMEQKGYEYQFYSDSEARGILQEHFPPEVLSAYDDLLPGAFKADLFRCCVLLIYGGVYADIDILMASQLDDLIMNNTGFVVALDKLRFSPSNGALCLWNGLLAASPGHPYLAKTIENIVNVVRNRYNQVDLAHMVSCPLRTTNDLEMTTYAVLLATGPCMLGLSVNQASGRHEQSYFEVGEEHGSREIPGTTIYLFFGVVQNKVSR
jgi:Glycosyltransferase sugar-binding region containing DXD motif